MEGSPTEVCRERENFRLGLRKDGVLDKLNASCGELPQNEKIQATVNPKRRGRG